MITKEIQRQVVEWVAANEPDPPCMTVALWLAFSIKPAAVAHPVCPEGMLSTLELLCSVPELRRHLPRMKGVSSAWARLVKVWDEIEGTFFEEINANDLAPRTTGLLKQALGFSADVNQPVPVKGHP